MLSTFPENTALFFILGWPGRPGRVGHMFAVKVISNRSY